MGGRLNMKGMHRFGKNYNVSSRYAFLFSKYESGIERKQMPIYTR
jgi:hypothetical protein